MPICHNCQYLLRGDPNACLALHSAPDDIHVEHSCPDFAEGERAVKFNVESGWADEQIFQHEMPTSWTRPHPRPVLARRAPNTPAFRDGYIVQETRWGTILYDPYGRIVDSNPRPKTPDDDESISIYPADNLIVRHKQDGSTLYESYGG